MRKDSASSRRLKAALRAGPKSMKQLQAVCPRLSADYIWAMLSYWKADKTTPEPVKYSMKGE